MKFRPHLDLAHAYWKKAVKPGDLVIDATCGNGHDSAALAHLALIESDEGLLIAIDRQAQAIDATRKRLIQNFPCDVIDRIQFFNQCHSDFPKHILPGSVALIVYNLGYLPGGDKTVTTRDNTTNQSLKAALSLIRPGGLISITCYSGHPEGKIEEEAVLHFAGTLESNQWECCHHCWVNRQNSPSLLLLRKVSAKDILIS